ncbi:MAG: hypothetical protein AB7G28_03695 [Pirellulales bacterium]
MPLDWRFVLLCLAMSPAPPIAPAPADEISASKLHELVEQLHDPGGVKREIPPSKVTLKLDDVPIWQALAEIQRQTGNKAIDRENQGQAPDATAPKVSCNFKDEPYWSAIDDLLDGAVMDVESQSGETALALVGRPRGGIPRVGRAAYDGPFRIEAIDAQSQRNLRRPRDSSLMLQIQVAWEPRLRPIAITQAASDLEATAGELASLSPKQPDAVFSAEVPQGAQAVDMVLPFELPPRTAPAISTLRGKMWALVPGRQATFKFDNLAQAAGKSQRDGDIEVIIDSVRKNNDIWELHMRLKLDENNHALENHRGWAFDNRSYLVDAKGEVQENVGLETTSETDQEIGVAYFFDAPQLDGLTWVYETPVDMAETEVNFELRDIELP